jgi:serine phosphatase RsbU (regulator of sigma subunit)
MLHARRGGLFEPVATHGGLLGVFKDEHFSQANIQLQPGDKILLYSDGFEQAFPEHGQGASAPRLPNRRYLQVFNEFASLDDPQAFVDAITDRLEEERSVFPLVDDVTLLCSAWQP